MFLLLFSINITLLKTLEKLSATALKFLSVISLRKFKWNSFGKSIANTLGNLFCNDPSVCCLEFLQYFSEILRFFLWKFRNQFHCEFFRKIFQQCLWKVLQDCFCNFCTSYENSLENLCDFFSIALGVPLATSLEFSLKISSTIVQFSKFLKLLKIFFSFFENFFRYPQQILYKLLR